MTNHRGTVCKICFALFMTSTPTMSIDELSSYFPLTFPIPQPTTHPDLITTKDLQREEDLLRNPTSFRAWWSAIHSTRENFYALHKLEPNTPEHVVAILGPLASPLARLTLQRLTYLFEAALSQFPTSFKLWKAYLNMRMSFVLGKLILKKKSGGKKKFPDMKDALEEAEEELEQWETPLDPIVGWEEWKSLIAAFERALMWLPKVSRIAKVFHCDNRSSCPASSDMAPVFFSFLSSKMSLPSFIHTCEAYF
jgi:pre-mRNA-splicing factor SYF1